MSKSRAWCFTVNNPTDSDNNDIRQLESVSEYGICEDEVGESGTPHIQGYVYFKNPRTMKGVSRLIRRAALFAAKGTAEDNKKYCSKSGTNIREWGTIPQQGKRGDLETIKEMIKDGKPITEVIDTCSGYQAMRMAETLFKYKQPPRRREVNVRWYHGPTGTGKTYTAFKEAEEIGEVWVSNGSLRWWDGYCGQKCVILDDFRGDCCKFHELLRILDVYPLRVEVKGGHMPLEATDIWVTSSKHPATVYNRLPDDVAQLLRRIKTVRDFELENSREIAGTEVTGNIVPVTSTQPWEDAPMAVHSIGKGVLSGSTD